jgi:hypothetical protein
MYPIVMMETLTMEMDAIPLALLKSATPAQVAAKNSLILAWRYAEMEYIPKTSVVMMEIHLTRMGKLYKINMLRCSSTCEIEAGYQCIRGLDQAMPLKDTCA